MTTFSVVAITEFKRKMARAESWPSFQDKA